MTEIINSKIYNPEDLEEVKDMSVDRDCADVSMEREDEDTLVHVKSQQTMMNGLIIWNKNNDKSFSRSQLRVNCTLTNNNLGTDSELFSTCTRF